MRALTGRDGANGWCPADQVGEVVHAHDVSQIPRPASLAQCPELLAKQFGQRIAQNAVARKRGVAVLMPDFPSYGTVDEHLVSGEIELDLGRDRLSAWAALGKSSLSGVVSAPVAPPPECSRVQRELNARLFPDPVGDLS